MGSDQSNLADNKPEAIVDPLWSKKPSYTVGNESSDNSGVNSNFGVDPLWSKKPSYTLCSASEASPLDESTKVMEIDPLWSKKSILSSPQSATLVNSPKFLFKDMSKEDIKSPDSFLLPSSSPSLRRSELTLSKGEEDTLVSANSKSSLILPEASTDPQRKASSTLGSENSFQDCEIQLSDKKLEHINKGALNSPTLKAADALFTRIAGAFRGHHGENPNKSSNRIKNSSNRCENIKSTSIEEYNMERKVDPVSPRNIFGH